MEDSGEGTRRHDELAAQSDPRRRGADLPGTAPSHIRFHSACGRHRLDRIELPLSGDAPEFVPAPIAKLNIGFLNRLPHRFGNEHLSWLRLRHHPSGGVDSQAAELLPAHLHVTQVNSGSRLQPELLDRCPYRVGTLQPSHRPAKGGEEGIAGRVHFVAVEARQL